MIDKKKRSLRTTKTGWAARIIGSLAGLFWMFSVVTHAIVEFGEPIMWEGYVVGSSAVILSAGIILAWFKEKAGGILLIAASLAFMVFSYIVAGHNKIFAALVSGFPFLIAGILFLVSWKLSSKSA
ncbi:MAG: hypothetical protein E3J58_03285 [Actinomycetota bacterium]|nr:MAG: hypothetical protein E3J58_03285 [Actinomycetota bacterium]